MNRLVPMQVLYWPHHDHAECGVMLLDVPTGEPRWLPILPLENDAWGDGCVRPDTEHLFQCSLNWWEMRRLPTDPPRQTHATGKGRIKRSYN